MCGTVAGMLQVTILGMEARLCIYLGQRRGDNGRRRRLEPIGARWKVRWQWWGEKYIDEADRILTAMCKRKKGLLEFVITYVGTEIEYIEQKSSSLRRTQSNIYRV